MDIILLLQEKVSQICKEKYQASGTGTQFIVSVYQEKNNKTNKIDNHKIMLTVARCGLAHSRVIFPQVEYKYGYETLEQEMEWLYNSTM